MKKKLWIIMILVILIMIPITARCQDEQTESTDMTNETIDQLIAEIDQEISILEKKKETLLNMKTEDTSDIPWTIKYFVDDFDRPTEDPYLEISFDGKFSNSAVDNAKLTGRIIIDDYFAAIYLKEYGSNPVKNYLSEGKTFYMVLADGDDSYRLRWRFPAGSNRLIVQEDALYEKFDENGNFVNYVYNFFLTYLKEHDSITFKLTNDMSKTDSYLVTIDDIHGFAELFDSTFP